MSQLSLHSSLFLRNCFPEILCSHQWFLHWRCCVSNCTVWDVRTECYISQRNRQIWEIELTYSHIETGFQEDLWPTLCCSFVFVSISWWTGMRVKVIGLNDMSSFFNITLSFKSNSISDKLLLLKSMSEMSLTDANVFLGKCLSLLLDNTIESNFVKNSRLLLNCWSLVPNSFPVKMIFADWCAFEGALTYSFKTTVR